MAMVTQNALYYGDNLGILREYVDDDSVDLIYLDPPFNSNASYNVLFREESGARSSAQIRAFSDTWEWTQEAERTMEEEIVLNPETPAAVVDLITSLRQFIGSNAMMAYLVMMAPRLVELRRVLRVTGSIYLHCDPTASHYLKILMDSVFGKEQFRNEIIWRRTGTHNKVNRFGPIHDTILFYTKSDDYKWRQTTRPYMRGHAEQYFVEADDGWRTNYYGNVLTGSGIRGGESGMPWQGFDPTARGRHWAIPRRLLAEVPEDMIELTQHQKLDRLLELGFITIEEGNAWPIYVHTITPESGQPVSDIWAYQPYTEGTVLGTEEGIDADVRWLSPNDRERLGYQTQKPQALVERIIRSSTDRGDVVLDPFCGCGTAIAAAERLGRGWVGVDITHLAIALMKNRLETAFNIIPNEDYEVVGEPADLESARALAEQDRFQFQYWATSLVSAIPRERNRRGPDQGIDGVIRFIDGYRRTPHRVIISVKSGRVSVADIRELRGTVEREHASMGFFITLRRPTRAMTAEAVTAGFYRSDIWQRDYPKIQIRTIAELLERRGFELPERLPAIQPARRVRQQQGRQGRLGEVPGDGEH